MKRIAIRAIRVCLVAVFACSLVIDVHAQRKLHIVVVEGEDAVNVIQQRTAVAPIVEVRDQNDQPVAGATVTFALKGGNAKATLGNGLRQLVATTDAAGRASVAVNPVANGAVQIEATASLGGQTASTTIAQTNVATAADATKLSSGGGHTGLIITSAALAGGGIAGWKYYEKYTAEEEPGLAVDPGCFISGVIGASVTAQGGPSTAVFDTSCKWSAASDQDWLTLTGTTSGDALGGLDVASGTTITLTFNVQPNPATTSRTARITVTTRHAPFIISVTQAAARAGTNSLFALEGRAVTASRAAGCGASVAIESMQVQRTGDSGATVLASLNSGCGAITSYSSTATVRGDVITARLAGAGAGLPASLEFDGRLEGDYIRGVITAPDFRQPVVLRQR